MLFSASMHRNSQGAALVGMAMCYKTVSFVKVGHYPRPMSGGNLPFAAARQPASTGCWHRLLPAGKVMPLSRSIED